MNNQDTTRAEKLQISIDETKDEINNFQLVINGLEKVKPADNEVKTDIEVLINKYKKEVEFLEDLQKDDLNTLNKLQ